MITAAVAAIIIGCGGGGGGGGSSPTTTTGTTTTGTTTTGTTTTGTNSGGTNSGGTNSGGTNSGGTSAGGTTSGSLPQNAILFGQFQSSTTYQVMALNPSAAASSTNPTVYQSNVPDTTSVFVQNPNVTNQFVFAANSGDNPANLVGIYSNSSLTTVGATTLAPAAYGSVVSLSLTQDGKNIVFTAYDSSNNVSSLYTMSSTGANLTLLDTSEGSSISPADSDTIVYSNNLSGLTYQLYTRSLKAGASGKPQQLTTDTAGDKFVPVFSRDGSKVAYQFSNNTTFVSNVAVITTSSGAVVNLPASSYAPVAQAFNGSGTNVGILAQDNTSGNVEILNQAISATSSPSVLYNPSPTANIDFSAGIYWTTSGGRTAGGGGVLGASIRRILRNAVREAQTAAKISGRPTKTRR